MELDGENIGIKKFGTKNKEERISSGINTDQAAPVSKRSEIITRKKSLTEEKTVATNLDLFSEPNKQSTVIKKPKQILREEPIKLTELKKIIRTKPGQKRARKIRRAL